MAAELTLSCGGRSNRPICDAHARCTGHARRLPSTHEAFGARKEHFPTRPSEDSFMLIARRSLLTASRCKWARPAATSGCQLRWSF
eukprot:1352122-Prymnesium_polylepis.2